MKLSIITVTYNNKAGLLRTAKSVAEQVFQDFEWLVVDGGSVDGSQDVLAEYAPIIAWSISEPDCGIYDAMNKGLAMAQGDFVQFLNAGDSFLDQNVLAYVFSDKRLEDVNYGDQWCVHGETLVEKRQYPPTMDLPFLFNAPLGHQATFIKTDLAKGHPYRTTFSISADRALFLELYLSGASFHYLGIPIVYFDADGIGSREETREQRRQQLDQIKKTLLPPPAIRDFEQLMKKAEGFDFVQRVLPLRWAYSFFKWLQKNTTSRWNRIL